MLASGSMNANIATRYSSRSQATAASTVPMEAFLAHLFKRRARTGHAAAASPNSYKRKIPQSDVLRMGRSGQSPSLNQANRSTPVEKRAWPIGRHSDSSALQTASHQFREIENLNPRDGLSYAERFSWKHACAKTCARRCRDGCSKARTKSIRHSRINQCLFHV